MWQTLPQHWHNDMKERQSIGSPTSIYQTKLFEAFKDRTILSWRPLHHIFHPCWIEVHMIADTRLHSFFSHVHWKWSVSLGISLLLVLNTETRNVAGRPRNTFDSIPIPNSSSIVDKLQTMCYVCIFIAFTCCVYQTLFLLRGVTTV